MKNYSQQCNEYTKYAYTNIMFKVIFHCTSCSLKIYIESGVFQTKLIRPYLDLNLQHLNNGASTLPMRYVAV